ncbi:MAG: SGNH/GDSL hydrolase family protein [Acidobacteriia bacterium]|nr:SGNH/GDSL hydrolase family protein [Terriglobia bacterium]
MNPHRARLRLLTLIAAAAVSLALSEAGLRVAGPPWLRAHMDELAAGHQILGEASTALAYVEHRGDGAFVRFRPGGSFSLLDPEFRTAVQITRWGTRATGTDAAGPDTVVFVGDSFTFGMGVNDGETFVSLVCDTRHLSCLNAGFPASALPNQLDVVEQNFAAWGRPRRIVFVFFAGNDLPEMIAFDQAARGEPQPRASRTARVAGIVNSALNATPALNRSYLLQLMKATSRAWIAPQGMDLMFVTAAGARGDFGRQAEAALDRSLDRLERVSSALGFSPVFVIIPDRYQVYASAAADKARYYRLDPGDLDMRFPQQALGRALDRRGIPYLDLLSCAEAQAQGLYYRSDNHLTPAGHAAVGRCLLRARGIL